jgi:hypothetical protein
LLTLNCPWLERHVEDRQTLPKLCQCIYITGNTNTTHDITPGWRFDLCIDPCRPCDVTDSPQASPLQRSPARATVIRAALLALRAARTGCNDITEEDAHD